MKNLKLFFWAIFIQVFILNNIQLSGYINPYYYVIFIFAIPSKNSSAQTLFFSFLIGFVIDLFSYSYGVHAFASVLIGYLKILWVRKGNSMKDSEEEFEIRILSINQFLIFSFYLVFIHHFTLFALDQFNFNQFFSILKVTLTSTMFTVLLLLIHKLFSIQKT
ncbi:MAG: rod shape-determining protein MreD [Flavobacteriales bacterium]|nr:rod shape-determining protein MreD [Flavobacteriales bacterium]|tara:strand:- start:3431 stop:3919 length:489 start_codon:yes stop_codon:yes gene_type:complete